MIRIFAIAILTLSQSFAASIPPESMQAVREHVVLVGRVGREILRSGVLLGEGDLVLTPKISPVDEQPADYLILLDDGRIIPAETLENADDATFEILKLPEPVGPGLKALKFPDDAEPSPPFLSASVPLSLLEDEPVQIHLARTPKPDDEKEATDEDETSEEDQKADPYLLDLALTRGGHPLFDFTGNLVALTTSFDEETQSISWLALDDALRDCPEAMELLTEAGPASSASAIEAPADIATPAWLVPIVNGDTDDTGGTHAVVIDSSGLLLSKASDLGNKLTTRIGDEDLPVALLATDETTDLALLAVAKDGLEVIPWSDTPPIPGSIVHAPVITPCEPNKRMLLHGTMSHTLPTHPMSPPVYWSAEQVTSLGILLEQTKMQPRIVRLLDKSPAAAAGAQVGDLLETLDGKPLPHRAALRELLSQHKVGDQVSLAIKRGDESLDLKVKLGAARLRAPGLTEGKLSEVPTFQGLPNLRRSGFPETWVHDAPLAPWQMGTALVDDDGHALGINIA
ncbi:PDZ domain-containing protein, partial [Haloferula sp.]|uniref:PDZ domain-containing protein n=1 Tax=Haloferula sp. TaxID=2497595 RepID=UPI003C71235B